MYIKRLEIDPFEECGPIGISFAEDVTVIDHNVGQTVVGAIKLLLLYSSQYGVDLPFSAGKPAKLFAEVVAGDATYHVRSCGLAGGLTVQRLAKDGTITRAEEAYCALMRRCAEENRISIVAGVHNGSDYGLERYRREDRYYGAGVFARVTDGMCLTHSFRRCVRQHMRQNAAEAPNADTPARPWIDTVRFWNAFGKMRDLHYEGKPLVVDQTLLSFVSAPVLFRMTGRQVLIVT